MAIRYYQSTANGDWDTAANWNTKADGTGTAGIPQDGDDVDFSHTQDAIFCTVPPSAAIVINNFYDPYQSLYFVLNSVSPVVIQGTYTLNDYGANVAYLTFDNCVINLLGSTASSINNCIFIGDPAILLQPSGSVLDGGGNAGLANVQVVKQSSGSSTGTNTITHAVTLGGGTGGGTSGSADTFFDAVYSQIAQASASTQFANILLAADGAGTVQANVVNWLGYYINIGYDGNPVVSSNNMPPSNFGAFNISAITDTTHLTGSPDNGSTLGVASVLLAGCGLRVYPLPNGAGDGISVSEILSYDPNTHAMVLLEPLTADMVANYPNYTAVMLPPDQLAAWKVSHDYANIASAVFANELFGGEYTFQQVVEKSGIVLWGDSLPTSTTAGGNTITTNPYTLHNASGTVLFSSTVTRNAATGTIVSRTGADGTLP